jgi:hypothetical protein
MIFFDFNKKIYYNYIIIQKKKRYFIMRLKEQVEKEIRAIYRAKNEAKKANDTELVNIYQGMYEALNWVLDSRNSPYYSMVIPVDPRQNRQPQ